MTIFLREALKPSKAIRIDMVNERDFAIYCPYCHKHTALHIANAASGSVRCVSETKMGRWIIGVCNACDNAVLIHFKKGASVGDTYPNPLPEPTDEHVPEEIRRDIDEAKLCASVGAFNGAAVLYRRALEMICDEKGAPEKLRLNEKIDWLLINQIITKDIKDWAHTVRVVGNDIAHPSGKKRPKLDEEDAIDMGELVDKLAYTLYVTGAIAKKQKEKGKGV